MTLIKEAKNHTYDVIILGAGSAGLAAQDEVAKKTSNYLVIADGPLGTTCARVGCMPSKVFIEASDIYYQHHKFAQIGVQGGGDLHVDLQKFMNHVRSLRDRFVAGVLKSMDSWIHTHLYLGRAQIISPTHLRVGDFEVTARRVIVATGASPVVPEEWKNISDKIYTSENFFSLETPPHRIAVLGMGPVGLELAQALARLDIEVFLFGNDKKIGGITDPEILEVVRKQLKKNLSFIPERVIELRPHHEGVEVTTAHSSYRVDGVLLAVGRRPNIASLGLENLGIALDKNGLPPINPKSTRIEGTIFYLAGDVSNHLPLLHEAVDEGRIAGYNATRNEDEEFDRRTRLSITYSGPQIAIVGKSFRDLEQDGDNYEVGSVSYEKQGRAVARLENCGLLKVYAHKETGVLLGAEIFSPSAEHLAHLLAWSIDDKKTVFELLAKPYYHPVLEEGLRTALRNLAKKLPKRDSDFDLSRCQDMPVGTYLEDPPAGSAF